MARDDKDYVYYSAERTENGVDTATKLGFHIYDEDYTSDERLEITKRIHGITLELIRLRTWCETKKAEKEERKHAERQLSDA